MTERIKTIGYGDNDPRCRDYRVQNPPIPYDPKQEVRNRFQQFVEENRRLREMGGVIKNPENGRTIFSNQVLHSQPEEELIVCGGGERSEFHAVRGLEASGPVLSKVSGVGGRVGGVVERDGSECIQILNSGDEKESNLVVNAGKKRKKIKTSNSNYYKRIICIKYCSSLRSASCTS